MPSAAHGVAKLLLASSVIILLSNLDLSAITDGYIELMLMGRVPGTDIQIAFDAFFAGILFFAWATMTYNFTIVALVKIHHDIKISLNNPTTEIDEIAL